MIDEWNSKVCVSDLCKKWKKNRPDNSDNNLLFLLYNIHSLNSHIADMDVLLNNYAPQIIILTEIGSVVLKKPPSFPEYHIIIQEGTNSFGGVAILCHRSIKYKEIGREKNFILIQIETIPEPTLIGAVYVPPGESPPFHFFSKCRNKPFFIFGDFNAKHSSWDCDINNDSGNKIASWLEKTGNSMIVPNKPTSRRSNSIIGFGLTHDASGWITEVLDEGTSDHYPVLIQSPLFVENSNNFRLEWIKKDNNIWKFTRPIFHVFTPPFRGITTNDEKIKQPRKIVDLLADHYEKHFDEPEPDNNNPFHFECLSIYDKISRAPTLPLEPISIIE
ncbi:unnamed protein product, partial [Rotaria sp. Silwood1]